MNKDPRYVQRFTLRARDIADLTVTAGYPCISILTPTRPAPRMTPEDVADLQRLVAQVDEQLAEHGVTGRERLVRKLTEQVSKAAAGPTSASLAIFVSAAVARTFRLPQTVQPRALVEPTFATRALVSALHRIPPHLVLALHTTCAHLYAAADGTLRPVKQIDHLGRLLPDLQPAHTHEFEVAQARTDRTQDYLRDVDEMLGRYRVEHPSPLVLAGTPVLLERFRARSRHLERLAGPVILGPQDTAADVITRCSEAVEDYLRARRKDALQQLAQAEQDRPSEVSSGIAQCWRNARSTRPQLLLVEDDYISPGNPADFEPSTDCELLADSVADVDPSITERASTGLEVHDLVDDLMERVITLGGQLALVNPGELAEHDHIALVSHPRRRTQS